MRNLPGALRTEIQCRFYHPQGYRTLRHTTCNSRECHMFQKSKVDRDTAEAEIHRKKIKKNTKPYKKNMMFVRFHTFKLIYVLFEIKVLHYFNYSIHTTSQYCQRKRISSLRSRYTMFRTYIIDILDKIKILKYHHIAFRVVVKRYKQ